MAFTLLLISLSAIAGSALPHDRPAPTKTFPEVPLISKAVKYPDEMPYQVDTETDLVRGGQFGYNKCNSTTEGPNSKCQTAFLNSIDDFCVWGPAEPNSLIADTEGDQVAWCSKPGRGTRLIPQGALQGVQYMKTPDYVQVVGFIDQTQVNIRKDDAGGELSPHGADLRGNPLGGLVYSNAWSNGTNETFTQAMEWHNFMGSGMFCFKACDPSKPNAAKFCDYVYNRMGCAYNAPNDAKKGTFEVCEGDNQDYPGVYTVDGQETTYTQPPEKFGAIQTMPYTPRVPSSSNCVQYTSTALYNAIATVLPTSGPFASDGTSASVAQSLASAAQQSAAQSSAAAASASASRSNGPGPSSAPQSASSTSLQAGSFTALFGVLVSVLFFA